MSADARRAYYNNALANAAALRRAAACPDATNDAIARADRAEAELVGLRSRMAAMGDALPVPVIVPAPVASVASAAPAVAPSIQTASQNKSVMVDEVELTVQRILAA